MPQIKRNVSLSVFVIKEQDYFVAYTPALDFAATGDTSESAKKNFSESINIFLSDIEERGTLDEVLKEFGWRKIDKSLQPPEIVSQTEEKVELPSYA